MLSGSGTLKSRSRIRIHNHNTAFQIGLVLPVLVPLPLLPRDFSVSPV